MAWQGATLVEQGAVAHMAGGSEYGGEPGIIQSPEPKVTDNGVVAPGHTELTVREAAQLGRRAGLKEANGGLTPEGLPYTEEQALEDYVNGKNT